MLFDIAAFLWSLAIWSCGDHCYCIYVSYIGACLP